MNEKLWVVLSDILGVRSNRKDRSVHLKEAVRWIYRAQDGTPDRGVSHSYKLGEGWMPSYPETTGYIIPTLLNWAVVSGDGEAERRAIEMADWEMGIQLQNGSIPGSVVGRPNIGPVVFNTGQVIFGWVAVYRKTEKTIYRECAEKAAGWLVANIDADGTWSTHGNMGRDDIHTYNIRVAWAILELWKTTRDKVLLEPMTYVIRWCLAQEESNGWFRYNCLNRHDRPLLHTIAYTAQGLLEAGIILENERAITASRRTADVVLERIGPGGRLAGRYDRHWNPVTSWACLTGMAQMAIVWARLYGLTGDKKYLDAAGRVNAFLMGTQHLDTKNPGLRGGIQGSFPIYGEYGAYRLLNWAAKFFIDAMILESNPALATSDTYFRG